MGSTRYRGEIEAFRREREESLRQEAGWLSQVALVWLEHECAELDIGSVSVTDAGVRFVAAHGFDVQLNGVPARDILLRMETEDSPDVLSHGQRRYQLVKRAGALGVRVRDSNAPARRRFGGLSWYPVDEAWRIVGKLSPTHGQREQMHFTGGQEEETEIPGLISFTAQDREHRLVPYSRPDGSLLCVFRDLTNIDQTYELCRYFYTSAPDADGSVVLDFNRAAAPTCAFVPFVTCVLPPPENRLSLRVEAGELRHVEALFGEDGA